MQSGVNKLAKRAMKKAFSLYLQGNNVLKKTHPKTEFYLSSLVLLCFYEIKAYLMNTF